MVEVTLKSASLLVQMRLENPELLVQIAHNVRQQIGGAEVIFTVTFLMALRT